MKRFIMSKSTKRTNKSNHLCWKTSHWPINSQISRKNLKTSTSWTNLCFTRSQSRTTTTKKSQSKQVKAKAKSSNYPKILKTTSKPNSKKSSRSLNKLLKEWMKSLNNMISCSKRWLNWTATMNKSKKWMKKCWRSLKRIMRNSKQSRKSLTIISTLFLFSPRKIAAWTKSWKVNSILSNLKKNSFMILSWSISKKRQRCKQRSTNFQLQTIISAVNLCLCKLLTIKTSKNLMKLVLWETSLACLCSEKEKQ